MIDMGAFSDEFVVVRKGQHDGDSSEITINCPDKVGLGCDLARIVFEFGLTVVKGGKNSFQRSVHEIYFLRGSIEHLR